MMSRAFQDDKCQEAPNYLLTGLVLVGFQDEDDCVAIVVATGLFENSSGVQEEEV